MLIIIYLLDDEQELILGMLIHPKRIYNFCLLHAYFVWLCHVFLKLPYTFEHIWTNLLTQCTQLPVVVFCCFCISGFPAIKSAPKIPEKLDKKSALRKLPERSREGRGPPPGDQKGPWRGATLGRARGPPGFLVGPPGAPLRLY